MGTVALLAFACATTQREAAKSPTVCDRGLCARIVSRELTNVVELEVAAPPNVALFNAWVAVSDGPPCRGGRALNAVGARGGVRMKGPLPLVAQQKLKLAFTLTLSSGRFLDLDVRGPAESICLRLPVDASPAADAGVAEAARHE
ncbi:MAG TPA: hypothetical protein VH560_17330 [Polyangia bacterium]|jgi:hypothetical protein|nr:hypothetical protein [Polyangia bacterium]